MALIKHLLPYIASFITVIAIWFIIISGIKVNKVNVTSNTAVAQDKNQLYVEYLGETNDTKFYTFKRNGMICFYTTVGTRVSDGGSSALSCVKE